MKPIIAVVESHSTSLLLLHAIKRRGYTLALLRGPVGSLHRNPHLELGQDLCEHVISCNPDDVSSIVQACQTLPKGQLKNILTISDYSVAAVAQAAEQLDLSFTSSKGVKAAKDKFQAKELLRKAGVISSRSEIIAKPVQNRKQIEAFGYPAVLKPRLGSASVQVYILRNTADLDRALQQISQAQEQAASMLQNALSRSDFIIETYLEGPMLSLEVARARNKTMLLTAGQRARASEDEAIEISTLLPGLFGNAKVHSLCETFVTQICDVLGLDKGVFHIECVLTKQGLELIEVNPRLMGGSLPVMYTRMHQTDIFDLLCAVYLEDRLPVLAPVAKEFGLSCFLAPLRSGTVPMDFSLDVLRTMLPVNCDFAFFKHAGDTLTECRSNHDYIGRLSLYGDSVAAVLADRRHALNLLEAVLGIPFARPREFVNVGGI